MLGDAKQLTSLKLGRALFHERANAFEAIVRVETFKLGLYLPLQRFHQGIFFAREDGLFDGPDRNLRTFGYFFGKRGDRRLELVGGKKVVQDTKAMRGLRVDHFAEIEHFGGNGRADKLRRKYVPP